MTAASSLFVSIFAYVLGKEAEDPRAAVVAEIDAGERASWPAFRTLARLRARASPLALSVNHSSLIAKARSLALGAFLESGADRWVSIDDDVEASAADVELMLSAEDVDVLVAPCALRGGLGPQLNVAVLPDARVRQAGGAKVFEVEAAGMALSLVSRAAAETLYRDHAPLRFIDRTRGERGLGVFLEDVRDGAWHGEDTAFCGRVRSSGLRLEALCDTAVTHAGVPAYVDPAFVARLRSGDAA